jgi:glycosyltransferase involved in cell wall biosynthesis
MSQAEIPAPFVWVNIDTLRRWRRLFGISRTVQEVARSYLAEAKENRAAFFYMNEAGCVVRCSITEAEQLCALNGLETEAHADAHLKDAADARTSATQSIFQRWARAIPEGLSAVRHAMAGATMPLSLRPQDNAESLVAQPGDIILSVGADWDIDYRTLYRFAEKGCKIVSFCHDIIPVKLPHLASNLEWAEKMRAYFIEMARSSDIVLCNSRHTEADLRKFCREHDCALRKTALVTLGCNFAAQRSSAATANTREPYILFVSTIEKRKNHDVLYKAYIELAERHGKAGLPKLLCVGMMGWGVDELINDMEADPRVAGLFEFKHAVSDSELSQLYAGCLFTVYPSLYEGWGLPVGESLAHGKLALVANNSSLPEAGGKFCVYLKTYDAYAWADAIETYAFDADARAKAERNILENYLPQSWEQTGLDIKKVIAQAL